MPRLPSTSIPSPDVLGTRELTDQRKILRPDVSMVGKGLASFGRSVQETGQAVGEYWDNKTDFEVAEAEANFLIEKEKLDRQFDHDKDYGTIVERYSKGADDTLTKLADGIKDQNKKTAFLQRQNVRLESSRTTMEDKAFSREKDDKRGRLNESLNSLRDAAVQGNPEDMTQWIEAGVNMITSANVQDLYGDEEASKLTEMWRNDVTVKKLESMKPRDAVAALNSPIVEYIPADVRIDLGRKFEEKLREENAVSFVDENYTGDIESARKKVQAIKDPDARMDAEKRLDDVHNTRLRDESVERDRVFTLYGGQVVDGKMTVKQFQDDFGDAWEKLTPSQRENLKEHERQRIAGKTPINTPFDVTMSLFEKKAEAEKSGNFAPLLDHLRSVSSSMSVSDQKKWSAITIDGLNPGDAKSGLNDQQAMLGVMPEGLSKKEKSELINSIGDWRIKYQEDHGGKMPSDADRKKYISEQVVQVEGRFNIGEKRAFQLAGREKHIYGLVSQYYANKGDAIDDKKGRQAYNDFLDIDSEILEADPALISNPKAYRAAFTMKAKELGY